MIKKLVLLPALIAVLGIAFSPAAFSTPVGDGLGDPVFITDHSDFGPLPGDEFGWIVGDPGIPIEIVADPSSPPWIKRRNSSQLGGLSVTTP